MTYHKLLREARKIIELKQQESRDRFRGFSERIAAREKARVKYILWKMGVRRPSRDQVATVARVLFLSLEFEKTRRFKRDE